MKHTLKWAEAIHLVDKYVEEQFGGLDIGQDFLYYVRDFAAWYLTRSALCHCGITQFECSISKCAEILGRGEIPFYCEACGSDCRDDDGACDKCGAERPKSWIKTLTINGQDFKTSKHFLYYADIVHLIGWSLRELYTVTYVFAGKGRTLYPGGEAVTLRDGMLFDIAYTGNA